MKLKFLLAIWVMLLVVASYFFAYLPLLAVLIYGLMSALVILMYAKDKSAAKKKQWRVPESTLHISALCGGWPGAVVAQEQFRHKTQKTSFLLVFWLTVVLNMALLAALHYPPINDGLRLAMARADIALDSASASFHWVDVLAELFRYRTQ